VQTAGPNAPSDADADADPDAHNANHNDTDTDTPGPGRSNGRQPEGCRPLPSIHRLNRSSHHGVGMVPIVRLSSEATTGALVADPAR
jgi:hypothetical protein